VTELARIEPANNTLARRAPNLPQPAAGVTALQVWVETAQAAGQLVASIVDTPFFPAALWPKQTSNDPEREAQRRAQAIANGTGALIYGAELGLTPMNALTEVFVVHGRPSIYANTMVALVQAAGHEIWTESSTDTAAVVCGQRAGSAHVERVEFKMSDAKRAGYVAKNQKYVTDPVAMLYARAASIACKRTAPEVLKGIPSFEEVQDDPRVLRPGAPPVAGVPVSVAEITGAPPEPEPAADGAEPPEPAQPPAGRSLADRAAALVDWFAGKWAVPAEALAARVGRPQAEWTEDDVARLRDIGALLGKGQISVSDEFNVEPGDPPADEPVDGELVDDPPADDPAPVGVPANVMRRLFAMLADLGVRGDDRSGRLRVAGSVLNREVGSFSELTADDAHALVDALAIYLEAGDDGRATVAALAAPDQEPAK
jgi:hypothetical protein